ncbi:hypothetical protein BE17_22940 [Sorangium cellulosum]|uniref:Uncharacterized protein n=1 Tax=Sorangium cellulosum TaxID=56 RepID=A0A150QT59_SORCE|nr:hypothetical protein BE17_22940 [Sorangium cellulosum]
MSVLKRACIGHAGSAEVPEAHVSTDLDYPRPWTAPPGRREQPVAVEGELQHTAGRNGQEERFGLLRENSFSDGVELVRIDYAPDVDGPEALVT